MIGSAGRMTFLAGRAGDGGTGRFDHQQTPAIAATVTTATSNQEILLPTRETSGSDWPVPCSFIVVLSA
jgi:hypothetical protein